MRPLCADPSPLPASALTPQRSHPRDRPSHQCEPPAPARPHADPCRALAGGTRYVYIRRGLYPDLAIHPPGRHAPTPRNRHQVLRFRNFIWCCVFACAPKSGIYVNLCTLRDSSPPPRPRPLSRTRFVPISDSYSSGYARVLAVRHQAGGSDGQGQADVIAHCAIIQLRPR